MQKHRLSEQLVWFDTNAEIATEDLAQSAEQRTEVRKPRKNESSFEKRRKQTRVAERLSVTNGS